MPTHTPQTHKHGAHRKRHPDRWIALFIVALAIGSGVLAGRTGSRQPWEQSTTGTVPASNTPGSP